MGKDKIKGSKRKILCIVCPEGCEIEIAKNAGEISFSEGICTKGREYAKQEMFNPHRIVTSTVNVRNGDISMLPIRTSAPIPKNKIQYVMDVIANISIDAPVQVGQTIADDIDGTGIALKACRSIDCSN